ncbi:hypothetical protein RGQ29_029993 [Quercus rubra]|uniref:Uncharacterized protein n=1 Tax=Quercus rubra TaxID=3512 RepID=A0AAN7IHG0_QUERU|nr:hypothetical protein RGQ29_029993 [Quercus rubra]
MAMNLRLDVTDMENNHRSFCNDLAIVNEKQERRVRYHETRAQNLTIAYLILLGINTIAISHRSSTSLQCKNWWVPFTISLSSSIIYFMTFLNTVSKFYWTQYHLDLNYLDLQVIRTRIREAEFETKCHSTSEQKLDPVVLFKRKLYIAITVSALIAITVIQLYACRVLLC